MFIYKSSIESIQLSCYHLIINNISPLTLSLFIQENFRHDTPKILSLDDTPLSLLVLVSPGERKETKMVGNRRIHIMFCQNRQTRRWTMCVVVPRRLRGHLSFHLRDRLILKKLSEEVDEDSWRSVSSRHFLLWSLFVLSRWGPSVCRVNVPHLLTVYFNLDDLSSGITEPPVVPKVKIPRMHPKRAHTDDDAGNTHEILVEVDIWETTRVQNLQSCNVEVVSGLSRINRRVSRESTEVSNRQGRFLVSHPSWSGWGDFILVSWGLSSDSHYTCGVDQARSETHGARQWWSETDLRHGYKEVFTLRG